MGNFGEVFSSLAPVPTGEIGGRSSMTYHDSPYHQWEWMPQTRSTNLHLLLCKGALRKQECPPIPQRSDDLRTIESDRRWPLCTAKGVSQTPWVFRVFLMSTPEISVMRLL